MPPSNIDRIEIYESTDGYRWRAKAGNNEILAEGEAYESRSNAHRAVSEIYPDIPEDMVVDLEEPEV